MSRCAGYHYTLTPDTWCIQGPLVSLPITTTALRSLEMMWRRRTLYAYVIAYQLPGYVTEKNSLVKFSHATNLIRFRKWLVTLQRSEGKWTPASWVKVVCAVWPSAQPQPPLLFMFPHFGMYVLLHRVKLPQKALHRTLNLCASLLHGAQRAVTQRWKKGKDKDVVNMYHLSGLEWTSK